MAAVSVFIRTVSVIFNVYVSNTIGAVSMGLFSLISTVYGFAVTLATSGINLATTRLVAEAIGDERKECRDEGDAARIRAVMRQCIRYALFFSLLTSFLLFILADDIGTDILRERRTVSSLRLFSLTLVPISLSSVFCGYFSAVRRVYKNALTQVLGQAARIFASMLFFSVIGADDTESACICVVCGAVVSELLSFLLSFILYLTSKKGRASPRTADMRRQALKSLLSNALPLAFSAYMRSALVTVEHVLIPRGLQKSGSSRDSSLAAYGTVSSMVFPLVLFPSAVSASFAGLLIPEIAGSYQAGDERRIRGIISSVLECVLMFSIGVAGVMMSFSYELGATVYPEAADAGKYILLISPLIPVMYLDTAVDSMLKGLGEQVYCMGVNIADALCSVILVFCLLPVLGIDGYIVTVYFTELLNATLSITRLLIKSRVKTRAVLWVARPVFCVICATRLTRFLTAGISGITLQIALASAVYVALLIALGGIRPRRIITSIRYMTHQK